MRNLATGKYFLICSAVNGSDCLINLNETSNVTELLADAWPYIMQGLAKITSNVAEGITVCNQEVFPPSLVVNRTVYGSNKSLFFADFVL